MFGYTHCNRIEKLDLSLIFPPNIIALMVPVDLGLQLILVTPALNIFVKIFQKRRGQKNTHEPFFSKPNPKQ